MKFIRKSLPLFFGLVISLIIINNIDINADSVQLVNSNYKYSYTTTVDDPITLEELINEIDLNAYDSLGNNITANIVVSNPGSYIANVLNQPSTQSIILGNYPVEYRVYDKYGNTNVFKINISVVDNLAPVIDERSICCYDFNKLEVNENTIELIKRGIIVSDNHDYELNYYFDEGFALLTAMGFNRVKLIVSDKSGNESYIFMEISIEDEIGPKIYADTTYFTTTNIEEPLPIESIISLCGIYSIDLETNLECDIEVDYDNYTPNYNKNGVYIIRMFARDINGNITSFYVYIEVIDNIEPTFYLSTTKVTITTDVTFDIDKASELIKNKRLARNENYSLNIEKDDYTINKEKPGTYLYKVKATYEDNSESIFDFLITVEEKEEENENKDNEEVNTPSLKLFFTKTYKVLFKVIKWPIKKVEELINMITKKSLLFWLFKK